MNKRIRELRLQATLVETYTSHDGSVHEGKSVDLEKFAELIVEECRTVVNELYRKTPLELCGPLLTADEEIAHHFYGVEE
jgi:hypothetical protein